MKTSISQLRVFPLLQVAAVNSNTIVVMRIPGAVLTPWSSHPNITAILAQFLPGQESGHALASLLFGDVSPSGKLPVTFPQSMDTSWVSTAAQYPGVDHVAKYSEGLDMGYRYYHSQNDRAKKQGIGSNSKLEASSPAFVFGFGLTYTTWEWGKLVIAPAAAAKPSSNSIIATGPSAGDGFEPKWTVSFTLTNTGFRFAAQQVSSHRVRGVVSSHRVRSVVRPCFIFIHVRRLR
jgi:beta-glucosidase